MLFSQEMTVRQMSESSARATILKRRLTEKTQRPGIVLIPLPKTTAAAATSATPPSA